MKLSKNFSVKEFTTSAGMVIVPTDEQIFCLRTLCNNLLQPIRDEFGPFIVSSGFRSAELCVAIGSSIKSQHAKGEAADFEVAGVDNADLAVWIRDSLPFDQLILECYTGGNSGWIHCSYCSYRHNRGELLTFDRVNGYRKGLIL